MDFDDFPLFSKYNGILRKNSNGSYRLIHYFDDDLRIAWFQSISGGPKFRAWRVEGEVFTTIRTDAWGFYVKRGNYFFPFQKKFKHLPQRKIYGVYPFYVTDQGEPVWIRWDGTFSLQPSVSFIEDIEAYNRSRSIEANRKWKAKQVRSVRRYRHSYSIITQTSNHRWIVTFMGVTVGEGVESTRVQAERMAEAFIREHNVKLRTTDEADKFVKLLQD